MELAFLKEILFHGGTVWAQSIVLLIFGLLAWGTLLFLRHFGRIFWQFRLLKRVKAGFAAYQRARQAEREATQSGDGMETEPPFEENLVRLRDHLLSLASPKSIIAQRIRNLYQVRYVGHLTCETFQDLLYSRELQKVAFPRYLISSFILLGLIGTVLGLSQAVTHLQPMLGKVREIKDLHLLAGAITETLAGMRNAFSATLAGLLATVFLAFVNFLYGKYANRFLAALEEFTTVELVPQFLMPTPDGAALRLASSMQESAEVLLKTADPLTSLSERFETSMQRIENFSQTLKDVGDTYVTVLRQLREAQQDMLQQQGELRTERQEFKTLIQHYLEEFSENVKMLTAGATEAVRQVAGTQLEETQRTLSAIVSQNSNLLEQVAEAHASGYRSAREDFQTLVQGGQEAWTRLQHEIKEALTEYSRTLQALAQNHRQEAQQLASQVVHQVNQLAGEMREFFAGALKSHQDMVAAVLQRKLDSWQHIMDRQQEAISRYEELIRLESENLHNVIRIYDVATLVVDREHLREMKEREQRLLGALESLGRKLADFLSDVASGAGELQEPAKEDKMKTMVSLRIKQ